MASAKSLDVKLAKTVAVHRAINPGIATTEYRIAKSTGRWGILFAVLGAVVAAGDGILQAAGAVSPTGAIWAGMVISICGIVLKGLTDLGYVQSRGQVKAAALWAAPSLREDDLGTAGVVKAEISEPAAGGPAEGTSP